MKTYDEFLTEARDHETKYKELYDHAHHHYRGIAPDLEDAVPYGHGHTDAAEDHLADNLRDHFHQTHPKANFRKIARHVARSYGDDRKETRENEKKQKRAEAAAERARNAPPKQPKQPKVKARSPYGPNGITRGARKGIGSY